MASILAKQDDGLDFAAVQRMLSNKLVKGYSLADTTCPDCYTPLIDNNNKDDTIKDALFDSCADVKDLPAMIRAFGDEDVFIGAPFCVQCAAHVVMTEDQLKTLKTQQNEIKKLKRKEMKELALLKAQNAPEGDNSNEEMTMPDELTDSPTGSNTTSEESSIGASETELESMKQCTVR